MTHLTEQQRVLARYCEPLGSELASHLASCEECRTAMDDLGRTLDSIDDPGPELPADYEEVLWNRLRWKLANRRRTRDRWLATAAALVLLSIGVLAGRLFQSSRNVETAQAPGSARPTHTSPQATLATAAVTGQVERTERLLVEVSNLDSGTGDLRHETRAAERLLATNRVYRAVARDAGATELAALLEDIEPILIELAHGGSDLDASELEVLQQRIESRQLLFKLRVFSSSLRAESDSERLRPRSTQL
ncbi:MAG: hypothetical protein HYU52_14040 [Acidobacteria bacterium]|nr:hypothetical protein [Acidobacteriota bacterium]